MWKKLKSSESKHLFSEYKDGPGLKNMPAQTVQYKLAVGQRIKCRVLFSISAKSSGFVVIKSANLEPHHGQ